MILSNSSIDQEVVKLKKELKGMARGRDWALHANIKLVADNSNLNIDVKKFRIEKLPRAKNLKEKKNLLWL